MRVGWVRTYTGKHVNLLMPLPEDIELRDVAHHLSHESRWAGATSRFYSVAEHSIWVARFARRMVDAEEADLAVVHGLLHDAHEAYLKDIPTPIKRLLGPAYSSMAVNLDQAIALRFKLPTASLHVFESVHKADAYAAWCEAKALLTPVGGVTSGDEPGELLLREVPMLSEVRRAVEPKAAEEAWITWLRFTMRQVGCLA